MNLRRILQLALTSFFGQGINIITQLLIPPFFLQFYANGVERYGEWIALTASINYLGTLNYGIQTYANNQMTILYNRGEVEAAKSVQSSACRLLSILVCAFALGGSSVFFIPVASWLRLKYVSPSDASWTLYLLILQMAAVIVFSFFTNSYMVIGRLHRGNYWQNGQRLFAVLALSAAVWARASFPVLAAIQLGSLLLFFGFVFFDVRRLAPILLPSLRYGTWAQTRAMIKPSGHFGLIALAGFLTWQGPVILVQRTLGPAAVAVFALVRVVFQMSRQILSVASLMISQDITLLFGQRKWASLARLYDLSERVVLWLIPIVSVGSLLLCPFLFTVWLHKRALYDPALCILMAIASAVLGIKEHKTQFQSSSNEHEELSVFILAGYSCMLLASVFAMKSFGLAGFMICWIVWEVIQTAFVLRLNGKLFPDGFKVSVQPVGRLVVFMSISFALAAWPAYSEKNWPLPTVFGVAVAATAALGAAAYLAFGLDEVRKLVEGRIRRRFAH